ncbi:MAG: serine hydrolase [Proteobacteria bacterium]|nr:serine hydrolase [Pseudomonadota bacterium]
MNSGIRMVMAAMTAALVFTGPVFAQDEGALMPTHLQYRNRAGVGEPALHSMAALVLDTTHSSVLYSRHADVAMPIASITKLMTALVVTEAGQPLDEHLTITAEDRNLGRKGAGSRLAPGVQLTRGDLLHLALMASENRAAHALGRNYPGGIAACVRAMNAKAHALGMTSAHFVEPTGLSDENVASPADLAKLVQAAARVPLIREYSTDGNYTLRVGRRMMRFRTTDSLVTKPDWDIVVQKTGYISEAGRCLVMQTVIDERNVVIVLMNSFGKRTRTADARRVRRWLEATVRSRGSRLAAT